MMRDGHRFEGSALQIVRAMQDSAFSVDDLTVPSYIEWVVANVQKFEGVALSVIGGSDDELAASLVNGMIRAGLTYRL